MAKLKHLGIIMDGNRRWAKACGLPKLEGHRRGYDKIKKVGGWCLEKGIEILTVYAFSTENWNRELAEVKYLMWLLRRGLTKDLNYFYKKGIKIRIIGQKERLNKELQKAVLKAEEKTKNNKKGILNLAISYGGRPEIIQAIKKIIKNKIPAEKISEKLIERYLWLGDLPAPDLIIRTSGEQRLSNFLTWQSAYSELYFINKHWPDFTETDLDQAISEFNRRQRRFGK